MPPGTASGHFLARTGRMWHCGPLQQDTVRVTLGSRELSHLVGGTVSLEGIRALHPLLHLTCRGSCRYIQSKIPYKAAAVPKFRGFPIQALFQSIGVTEFRRVSSPTYGVWALGTDSRHGCYGICAGFLSKFRWSTSHTPKCKETPTAKLKT